MSFSFAKKSFIIEPSTADEIHFSECKGDTTVNTDKIYAQAIANEYSPKDTSKVVALKKLDRKAKSKANIFAYTLGVAAALVMGVGMCLSMNVIGGGTALSMTAGIVLGVVGIVGVGLNYPIYKRLLESGKRRYAFEIMQLAREISEEAE